MRIKLKAITEKGRDLANQADSFGKNYSIAQESIKSQMLRVEEQKQAIKAFAKKSGETADGKTVVLGRRFEVGYVLRAGRSSIDQVKAKKYLCSAIYNKVTSTVVDEAKVIEFVQADKISKELFLKICRQAEPSEAIHVKALKRGGA